MNQLHLLIPKGKRPNAKPRENGFGLLEAIISAIILAIMIATSISVTNKYQAMNYRSSLRQALAQTIDEDLTEVKLELESYLYQKKTKTNNACYATNRSCQQSTAGVGHCKTIAQRAIASSPIIKNGELSFNTQTHQLFKGLKGSSSGLKRIVSIEMPEAPKQSNQTVSRMDRSIVRVKYTLEGDLAEVLFNSAAAKTIGSVDLSPPAHASCQY